MKHHHSILVCEPGQVLIEAAISKAKMWVVVLDRDTFIKSACWLFLFLLSKVLLKCYNGDTRFKKINNLGAIK